MAANDIAEHMRKSPLHNVKLNHHHKTK